MKSRSSERGGGCVCLLRNQLSSKNLYGASPGKLTSKVKREMGDKGLSPIRCIGSGCVNYIFPSRDTEREPSNSNLLN